MQDYYKYSMQSPIISILRLKPLERREICEESFKIWGFITEYSNLTQSKKPKPYIYSPVLTILTREWRIREIIEKLTPPFKGPNISQPTTRKANCRCAQELIRFIKEYWESFDETFTRFFSNQNDLGEILQTDDCEKVKQFLRAFLDLLEYLESVDEKVRRKFLESFIAFFRTERISIREKPCQKYFLWEDQELTIEILMDWIDELYWDICPDPKLPASPVDPPSIRVIRRIIEEIHTKYGCYTPPRYWDYYTTPPGDAQYYTMLTKLGIGPLTNLWPIDLPCIFLFPILIRRRSRKIQKLLAEYKDVLKSAYSMTMVHEHTHAFLRHAIQLSPYKTPWFEKLNQQRKDDIRSKYSYIEEGIAMEFEFHYVKEKVDDISTRDAILKLLHEYVEQNTNLNDWPYAGYKVIDAWIYGCKIEKGGKIVDEVKGHEGEVPMLIQKWKETPEELIDEMEQIRSRLGFFFSKPK